MLAFAIYDAGAAVWGTTIANWNHWFTLANGTSTSVVAFWRYAASSADADITITHTSTADTLTASVVSVRDAYQGYTAGAGAPAYATTTQAASTRFAMPTVVTPENNCLLLHFLGTTASAGGVHFVENGAHELIVIDGAAEGMGLGWSFQKTAGTSAANIYACSNTTGVGIKSVITIRPPAGGAQAIPPFCVSDASIYLNPNGGTAAWDSCTQMAATADTNFGTSLGGKTANDATVAAVVDIGVNSYHSMMGLTNAATANQVSGAEVVMNAGRYNVGNRNILAHFRHPTPAHNQRLTALSTGRGVWMGMRSGATAGNNKIWQVHGADVPITAGYIQPVVVNAANTDTVHTAGTLSNSDVRGYGFWTAGIGVLTNQTCIGPMWAMDTLVMAGGTASEPITVPDIVAVAATGKERISSALQGANQMLCLQMIQFGDGGTNDLALDLNTAAIEFPSKKNYAKKRVNYNGIDNAVGFIFYPGDGQTIDMRSAVFSSPSKFTWKFHASSSATAAVQTAGAQVIGGGDVQFCANLPIDQMAFTDCLTITQNSAVVTDSSFTNCTITSATLGDMDNIANCSFVSGGTGHAIVVGGSAGTVTLTGNTITGYASSNGSTGNEAIYVNIASGTVTLNISGGSTPSIRTAGATVIVNNSVSVTLSAQVSLVGAEVRIYDLDNSPAGSFGTELSGVESHNAATYVYSGAVANAIMIQIMQAGYVEFTQQYTMPSANAVLGITLQPEENQ